MALYFTRHRQTSNDVYNLSMKLQKMLCLIAATFLALPAAQAANYKYNELMIKDYDEMLNMVQHLIKKGQKATSSTNAKDDDDEGNNPELVEAYRESLKLILSRPDTDNMTAKLIPEVRRELSNMSVYESTVAGIASEAIQNVKNDKAATSVQSTSLFILENILGQVRPEIANNAELRKVVESIRDAKLKISPEILKDRKIRGMFQTKNPSEIAAQQLKALGNKSKK